MATTAPAKPAKPEKVKKPRQKRAPSELSIANKSFSLLKRKITAREKFGAKIEALDAEILTLQNTTAENMKAVNDIIYGPDVSAAAGA